MVKDCRRDIGKEQRERGFHKGSTSHAQGGWAAEKAGPKGLALQRRVDYKCVGIYPPYRFRKEKEKERESMCSLQWLSCHIYSPASYSLRQTDTGTFDSLKM